MGESGSIFVKVDQRGVPPTIIAALASAVLEWFLIFLLFIHACFSYLVTNFARYSKLQIPCLMCSRLDHILGKEKDGFYWDLICKDHKLKISSLVICKHHNKLVDVRGICENCLFSFATVNKSNAETYRLLVGKLGDEPHHCVNHDPLLADHSLSSSDGRKCSCCNEQWISRGHTSMPFRKQSIGFESVDFGSSLLATDLPDMDEPEEIRDISSQEIRACHTEKKSIDPLSHVEYEKVKMTSDTESEGLLSDNECATNVFCVTEQGKANLSADYEEKDLSADNLASEKLIDPAALSEPSVVESELEVETSDLLCAASAAPIGNGLEELNSQHIAHKIDVSAPSDLISFIDVLPSTDAVQSSVHESRDNFHVVVVAESEKAVKNYSAMTELASDSIQETEKQSELKSGTNDSSSQMPSSLELVDAYKLAIGSRGRQLSGKLLEQKSFKDSTRMGEDLKLLLSQLSFARGIEVPLYDISPRVSGNIEEFRTSDPSNSIGIQMLQKRISLERNESGISLDGSIVSEIEGESAVERLKRQVEHDRKLMSALYKELEEERNASAVAANQAMAMITRLQEEKAGLQMETLQFVRMMEEQAEYDGEDLQKVNDLLAEKEREIQYLEVELQSYKKKLDDLSPTENIVEPHSGVNSGETRSKQTDTSSTQPNVSICNSDGNMPDRCTETDEAAKFMDVDTNMKSSLLEFEEETLFIIKSLRKLEKKLQLFSSDEGASLIVNGDNLSVKEKVRTSDCEQHECSSASLKNGETEEDRLFEHAVLHEIGHSADEVSAGQYEDNQQLLPGNGELKHEKLICRDAELDVLRKGFLVLSGRLEALEAEHSFLENSINSLSKGDEGLKFVRDIAYQVRELHSIGITSRN